MNIFPESLYWVQPKGSSFKYKKFSSVSKRSCCSWAAATINNNMLLSFSSQSSQTLLNNKLGLGMIQAPTPYLTWERLLDSSTKEYCWYTTPKYLPRSMLTQSSTIIGLSTLIINVSYTRYLTLTLATLLRPHSLQKCFTIHEATPALDIVHLSHKWQKTVRMKSGTQNVITRSIIPDQLLGQRKQIPFPNTAKRQISYQSQMQYPDETLTLMLAALLT